MNLADVRNLTQTVSGRNVVSTDTAGISVLNGCIGMAIGRIMRECPQAAGPSIEHYEVLPTYTGAATNRTITTTADSWVLLLSDTISGATIDNTWNWTYHLWITLASGRVVRYRCRDFWPVPGGTGVYISLDRPWDHGSLTATTAWTLRQPYVYLSESVMGVLGGRVFGSDEQRITVYELPAARAKGLIKSQTAQYSGTPTALVRGERFDPPAPTRAPSVASSATTWTSGEPTGTFQYAFTYCYGERSHNYGTPLGSVIPLHESGLSPASSSITQTTNGVDVTLPDISWMTKFNVSGTLRDGHSGIYKRIYRKRSAVSGSTNATIEYPNVWQFLADVDADDTSYTDDGSVIPDYGLRYEDRNGYYAWEVYPEPSAFTELELDVYRRATVPANDYDPVLIAPECIDALANFAAYYWLMDGRDPAQAVLVERQGVAALATYRSLYCTTARSVQRASFDEANPVAYAPVIYRQE
jgi:hypothetical protein